MDEFCLLVAIPRLRAPAKYDRFSVWCLNPGVILKIRPKSYFHEGRRMSAQRNFDTPPKNWGIFKVVPPRHGRTQLRIYDLFFVRGFVVCTTFVQP